MAGVYFSGKDAYFSMEGAGSEVETPLSDDFDIETAEPAVTTDQIIVKPWRAARAVKLTGHTDETWTIRGPLTIEADEFFRPMAGLAAGKNRNYTFGPYGNTAGLLQYTGALDVLTFQEFDAVNADAVPRFAATLQILTKVQSVFGT